jgi:hypothetical protein
MEAQRTIHEPSACQVNWNVLLCRSNKCGFYDSRRDACLKVIQIGEEKGQKRGGRVAWLHHNMSAKCPLDPPVFDQPGTPDSVAARIEQQEL